MRIGFMSSVDPDRIAFMKKHGFGCVELFAWPEDPFIPGKPDWQARAADAKAAFEDAGIRISCLAGFYANHMDADPAKAKAHHAHVRNVIVLAAEMGVPVVAGFSGRVLGEPLEASLSPFKKIWSEHARAAEDAGIKIAFEHCPMGKFHSPFEGTNAICTPAMWERCFDAVASDAIGLEWDASHLICQGIDPIVNIRRFASRIYHVHAKDAHVDRDIVARYGFYHDGAVEHCFPGLGDSDWRLIVKELLRIGYRGDLNIEGRHDAVFRDHADGLQLEDRGLLIALHHLRPLVDGQ